MTDLVLPSGKTRSLHHIGYVVPDIAAAVDTWHTVFNAGPFFVMKDIAFDEITYRGEACEFVHDAAFGQWGSIVVELQEITVAAPASVMELFVPARIPAVNHLAYVSESPEEDSAELIASGFGDVLYAQTGGLEIRLHDTRAAFGHSVEIHKASDALDALFGMIAAASVGWDGSDPLRQI